MEVKYTNTISVEDYNHLRKSVGWAELEGKQAQIGINNSAYSRFGFEIRPNEKVGAGMTQYIYYDKV